MGIYVNPDGIDFRRAVNEDIYIDKSGLIDYTNGRINKAMRYLCVSRPRRFGKSIAADMLVAYYSRGCDSSTLFSKLKVAQENECGPQEEKRDEQARLEAFRANLNQHNVIRLDVQRFLESEQDVRTFIGDIEYTVVEELTEEFPDCHGFDLNTRLKTTLDKIFKQTGKGFIFVIDEWDSVFRVTKEDREAQKQYLDFLRGLFKGAKYVELAYLTGILPIKKYGEHSALNIFDEYSVTDPKDLREYFGFTDDEVKAQCERYGMAYDEMEQWYDGYLVGGLHIYNPKSVVDALRWKAFHSYWTGTESYEALKGYIERNFDGLKEAITIMLGNGRCKINTRKFQNDMTSIRLKDDILTLLIHLGYLTFDDKTSEAFIPNREITGEFLNAVDEPGWDGLIKALDRSEELLKSTWNLDGKAVADGIATIHSETASILKYNDENSLTCALYVAYYSAKAYYTNPIFELPSGKGFADVVYLPRNNVDRPALVVELKWNKSAKGAVQQIKDKEYADWIKSYTGDILLVGINYNKNKTRHECIIERCNKT